MDYAMKRKLALIAILVTGLLVLLLMYALPRRAWTTEDPWFRDVPAELPQKWGPEWQEVSYKHSNTVPSANLPAAERLLADRAWCELSAAQVRELIGREKTVKDHAPSLVRSVFLSNEVGQYHITRFKGHVHVHHGCLGSTPVPMKRQALILFLPQKPTAVYSTCSMAE